MTLEPIPSAAELAAYLEARGEMVKPANLHLLRLAKLREARSKISPEEYLLRVEQAHGDLMRLSELWKGRDSEVVGGTNKPSALIEPIPGSPEDR